MRSSASWIWLSLVLCLAVLLVAESRPERIILNTDPGIDDAAAILFAVASPELHVEGLTVNFGNSINVTLLAENALRVLSVVNRTDIPVYAGMGTPIVDPLVNAGGEDFHGANALGGVQVELPSWPPVQSLHAVQYIIEACERFQGDISLVSIGPLTNIAVALRIEPRLTKWVNRVVIMGGAIAAPGNVSPVAEANVVNDAVAAHLVFSADWEVWMAGLDVTMQTRMTPEFVQSLLALGNRAGRLVYETTQFYQSAYKRFDGLDYVPLHDASAIAVMVRPDLYRFRKMHVDVESTGALAKGQTIADWHGVTKLPANTYALLEVDAPAVIELLRSRVAQLP